MGHLGSLGVKIPFLQRRLRQKPDDSLISISGKDHAFAAGVVRAY